MTPAKKFFVRMSLVTGSTLATIFGAQSLIALDLSTFSGSGNQAAVAPIVSSAPNLTVIRHSGNTANAGLSIEIIPHTTSGNPTTVTAPTVNIQPPAPVLVQPSVMMPAQPRTRSSR